MSEKNSITQARLKELMRYDPLTGLFTHLTSRGGVKIGSVAGSVSHGYIVIGIDGVVYLAHRLAFLYVLGYMPKEVDHDNHVTDDNRWTNLNPATRAKNMINKPLYHNNTSGHVGICQYKPTGKWKSQIVIDGKYIFLGYFTELSDAIDAREAADIKYGFHQNHGKPK